MAKLVTVPPAEPGDSTVLVVRSGGQTCMTMAVPPRVIRSRRLRGDRSPRDREAEHLYEMMRVIDARADDMTHGPAETLKTI
jgi:hypothetical protein